MCSFHQRQVSSHPGLKAAFGRLQSHSIWPRRVCAPTCAACRRGDGSALREAGDTGCVHSKETVNLRALRQGLRDSPSLGGSLSPWEAEIRAHEFSLAVITGAESLRYD